MRHKPPPKPLKAQLAGSFSTVQRNKQHYHITFVPWPGRSAVTGVADTLSIDASDSEDWAHVEALTLKCFYCWDWFVRKLNLEVPVQSLLDEHRLFLVLIKTWKSPCSARIQVPSASLFMDLENRDWMHCSQNPKGGDFARLLSYSLSLILGWAVAFALPGLDVRHLCGWTPKGHRWVIHPFQRKHEWSVWFKAENMSLGSSGYACGLICPIGIKTHSSTCTAWSKDLTASPHTSVVCMFCRMLF